MTSQEADKAAILALHQAFGEAWSRGDTETLAGLFTEDGARVGAGGDVQRGGYYVDVVKKVGGRWLVLETHPKLFPPR